MENIKLQLGCLVIIFYVVLIEKREVMNELISIIVPIYNIAVYDTKGILRYQNNYNGHIDLSHLNNGIYIIQIDTEEGKFSFKQIINNY